MATLRRGAAGASIKFYEAAPAHDAGIAGNPLRTRPTSQRISAGYTLPHEGQWRLFEPIRTVASMGP